MGNPLKKAVSKNQNGITNAQQRGDALARLGALETRQQLLAQQVRASFQKISEQVNALGQVVDALSQIIGLDQVQDKVLENRIAALEAQATAETESLEAALASGEMVTGATILPTSYVVTQQHNAEGELMHPSRVSIPFDGYKPEIKALLEGKAVGDVIELPEGAKLTVLGVYEVVQKTEASTETVVTPESTPGA